MRTPNALSSRNKFPLEYPSNGITPNSFSKRIFDIRRQILKDIQGLTVQIIFKR